MVSMGWDGVPLCGAGSGCVPLHRRPLTPPFQGDAHALNGVGGMQR